MTEEQLEPKPATGHTIAANRAAHDRLPFADRDDYDDAARGFIGSLEDPVIRRSDGHPVGLLDAHDFVLEDENSPDTVHPSLWRHARVNAHHGLFEVTDGIFQIRGFDLANMTIIEGDEGILVIDPLTFAETAAAGLALYRAHRGDRPVTALIYTHSHGDHYGGSRAIVDGAGEVPVIAPAGFLYEAVAENIFAGTAMLRRGFYMYGPMLPPGVRGHVNAGLANAIVNGGSATLVPPTDQISRSGDTRTIDGVRLVFQMAPGTEAPAEFLIHLPDRRALCAAEDVNHVMHNLYTLRGAQVRDAATWWKTLDETLTLFGDDTEVVLGQHGWPRWGSDRVRDLIENQRDMYKYIHDESLRLANLGYTMTEIAEEIELPDALTQEWYNRGYYGSLNHNAKAVYQRYLGWYDSHPAHLHQLPPQDAAKRYLAFMGGADAVVEKARASFNDGDYRWVADVLSHVVFADPTHRPAALLQADALEQLGYQAENATWRNEYLMAALELRHGVRDLGRVDLATADAFSAMTLDLIFDFAGIKLNGPRAASEEISLLWVLDDEDRTTPYALTVRNGVLLYREATEDAPADVVLRSDKATLTTALFSGTSVDELRTSGALDIEGDSAVIARFFALLDDFPVWFPIVQP